MFDQLTQNFRRVQLRLSLIFSLVTLLIIIGYSLLLAAGHRQARWRFETNVRREFNGDYREAAFVKEVWCVPPGEPYDRGAPAQTVSLTHALRKNWVIFDRHIYVRLVIFDLFIWLLASVSGYFFIGWLLQPVKVMTQTQQDFMANASHELKTPITTIKTELSLLNEEKMSASVKDGLQTITSETENLQNLVTKLLLVLSQGQKAVLVTTITANDLIAPLLARYQKIYRDKKLDFVLTGKRDCRLTTKVEFLQQVLELLLDNAGKYAHKNTVVTVNVEQTDAWINISVINQGIGIALSEHSLIWQRFYRVTKKEVQSQTGSGLGLPIARELARELNGRLTLVDGASAHTQFALSLPGDSCQKSQIEAQK